MDIIQKPISELFPTDYNPRKDLTARDVEYQEIKKSIQEFGAVVPIVWNKRSGNVVGGHQRLKIYKELKYTEVPVSTVDLSEKDERRLNLALNKTGGAWDEEKLKILLDELKEEEIIGFSEDELSELMGEDGENRKPKEEILKPFKQTHVLLSFPPEKILELQPLLEAILNIEGVEYEQSSN